MTVDTKYSTFLANIPNPLDSVWRTKLRHIAHRKGWSRLSSLRFNGVQRFTIRGKGRPCYRMEGASGHVSPMR